jgi:hypothetical protein
MISYGLGLGWRSAVSKRRSTPGRPGWYARVVRKGQGIALTFTSVTTIEIEERIAVNHSNGVVRALLHSSHYERNSDTELRFVGTANGQRKNSPVIMETCSRIVCYIASITSYWQWIERSVRKSTLYRCRYTVHSMNEIHTQGCPKNATSFFHHPDTQISYAIGWRISLEEQLYQDHPIRSGSFCCRAIFMMTK